MNRTENVPSTNAPVPAQPVPSGVAAVPVLHYEKPAEYRYRSDLPPPGWVVKIFWRMCYEFGRLLGLIYKPRLAPRLYTPRPRA